MMFELEPRAVVGRVDDVSVFSQLQLIQRIQQSTDFGIDMLDHIDVRIQRIRVSHIIRDI